MPVDSGDRRPARAQGNMASHPAPKLNEPLPCPRCQSTSTKFCYYNNYNLSQPRYFCKSCRRYWTHGGTLRNVPVGGGTRKTSTKRSRSSSSSSSASASPPVATSSSSTMTHEAESMPMSSNPLAIIPVLGVKTEMGLGDVNLNESVEEPGSGSFTSFLNSQGQGYLTLGGYGFGTGPGFDGIWGYPGSGYLGGFGGGGAAASGGGGSVGSSFGCNTWQMTSDVESGGLADGDCFGWPGLAISAPGKGLK